MAYGMQEYEETMAFRKCALFAQLFAKPVKSLLEVGVGTGANTKFYVGQQVNGMPFKQMLLLQQCFVRNT